MRKLYLPAILFTLVFFAITHCCAQAQSSSDTIPYNISQYKVKKGGSTVWDIARKLKVDAALIAKLNQFSDLDKRIAGGKSIVIPVYTKSKDGQSNNAKQVAQSGISNPHIDSVPVKQPEISPVNIELQKNRLLLIEATMELNQTLLQGVQASIDSLNVEDKPLTNPKDMQAKLHQMERQRDRILIKPYLAHIQDSLKTEITNEEKEKRDVEISLGEKPVTELSNNPAGSNPVVTENKVSPDAENKKSITDSPDTATVNAPALAEIKLPANTNAPDSIKPTEIASVTPEPAKRIVDVTSGQEAPVKKHWGTARALPSLTETFFLQGMRDITPITENNPETPSHDTLAYVSQFKPNTSHGGVDNQSNNVVNDSIDLIKSQLFVTRATAAINQRNNAMAEDYLQKAVDLNPNYYAAWFALADLHLQTSYPVKALNEFKICERLDNTSAKLYYKMGSAAFRSGQKEEAYKYFEKSLDIDSNYAPAIMGLAQTLAEKKQYSVAITEFGRVLTVNKGFHSAYKSRGIAEYMSGNFAAAIDDFTTYLLFEDKDAVTYYYRGVSEVNNGDAEDGCTDLSTAIRLKYYLAQKAMDKNCSHNK